MSPTLAAAMPTTMAAALATLVMAGLVARLAAALVVLRLVLLVTLRVALMAGRLAAVAALAAARRGIGIGAAVRAGDEGRQIVVDILAGLVGRAAIAIGPLVVVLAMLAVLVLLVVATALAGHAAPTVAAAPGTAVHAGFLLLTEALALVRLPAVRVARLAHPAVAAFRIAGIRLVRVTRSITLFGHGTSLFRCRAARQLDVLQGVTQRSVSAAW
jgi:hypothetical protein